MKKSKRNKPCCYLERHADITDLFKYRKKFSRQSGVRVTTNVFFIQAIAKAIRKFPLMAGKIDESGDNIQIAEKFGVGLAVAAPQGLVVPVIHDTQHKTFLEIAKKSDELINKARRNALVLDDFDGANIVLSSLGMFGVSSFLAITPPEATGIISIGTAENKAVPVGGEIAVRKCMSVALAADQRIVSEFYAAKFLSFLTEQLESPQSLTEN